MRKFLRHRLRSILFSEEAATLVEYSLLLALLAIACTTAMSSLGCGLSFTFFRAGILIGQ
jgi:Flp pilus assembly pilin Flp